MDLSKIVRDISCGRTDRIFELIKLPDWKSQLAEGQVKPLQWLIYYNDVTALEAVLFHGADLCSIDVNTELANAAFFGHWKVCDFLIQHGANKCRFPRILSQP